MKLKDNSRFGGRLVIAISYANLLKIKVLIKGARPKIGFADFQEDTDARLCLPRADQFCADAPSAKFRRHRKVQQFPAGRAREPRNGETGQWIVANRRPEIEAQG